MNNVSHSIKDAQIFNNKTSITGTLKGIGTTKYIEIVVSLKYLSNSLRTLDTELINCEILILTWSANCVIKDRLHRTADLNTNPGVAGIINPTDATFEITCRKLFKMIIIY